MARTTRGLAPEGPGPIRMRAGGLKGTDAATVSGMRRRIREGGEVLPLEESQHPQGLVRNDEMEFRPALDRLVFLAHLDEERRQPGHMAPQ